MDETLKNILQSIDTRFPSGRFSSRINTMINEEDDFDFDEIIGNLNGIVNADSNSRYDVNDKQDAAFYIIQLTEYWNKKE